MRGVMTTFKILPDFAVAMASVREYAVEVEQDDDYRAHFEAAATEAGWTDDEKTLFIAALLEAMCDLREKPH
jgi:hypothetical protein